MTNAPAPNRWLKMLTRKLIKACGGLEEASTACEAECRPYSVSHLHRATKVDYPAAYLPVDIVLCLEAYCGEPIITRAMADARPSATPVGDVRDELSDVTEGAAALLSRWRAIMADGKATEAERVEMTAAIMALRGEVDQALASVAAAPGGGA